MRGLSHLVVDATMPDDSAARRQARAILFTVAATWAALIVGPVLFALAFASGGHHGR